MSKEREQAIELFRKFRDADPEFIDRAGIIVPKYAMEIGLLDYVGYRTTIGREEIAFEHRFASKSRPRLCASADGKQLIIVGGRYDFKEDGIVDRDAHGRSIYPK
ncbi:MAG TPA: hypothetical protein VET48_04880 [Steroidobacteraceae bacterium]|nr:hypothetical protein [Steroidobacteraceae bacterium]